MQETWGVVITDGINQVAIDALHGNLDGWYKISTPDVSRLQNGELPFDNTDIVMTTHSHGDHINFTAINGLLSNQPNALYIGPTDTRSNMRPSAQLSTINPALGESETITHNGITVKVLRVIHFNQPGLDFSGVESYAFLVEIGGKKVLHLGDILYTAENLSPFNLSAEDISLVVIPTFSNLYNTSTRDLITDEIAPDNILAIHLNTSTSASAVQGVYPNATIMTEALDFKRY